MKRLSVLLLALLVILMAGVGSTAAPTTIYENDFTDPLDETDWLVNASDDGTFTSVDGQLLCDFDAAAGTTGMILYDDPGIDEAVITFDLDLTKNGTGTTWPAFVLRKSDPTTFAWFGNDALLYFNPWNCLAALGATIVADQGTDYNPAGVGVFSLPIRGTGNDIQEPVTFKLVMEGDFISVYYKALSAPESDLDVLRSKWYFPARTVSAGDPDLGIPPSDGSNYFGFMFANYTSGIDNLSIVQDVAPTVEPSAEPSVEPTLEPTAEATATVTAATVTPGTNPGTGDAGALIPLFLLAAGALAAIGTRRR